MSKKYCYKLTLKRSGTFNLGKKASKQTPSFWSPIILKIYASVLVKSVYKFKFNLMLRLFILVLMVKKLVVKMLFRNMDNVLKV